MQSLTSIAASEHGSFQEFSKAIVQEIRACFKEQIRSSKDKEKAVSVFHQIRISHLTSLWDNLHQSLHLPSPDPSWCQTVNKKLFDDISQEISLGTTLKEKGTSRRPLTADAENVIRYVAGYIPFKLLKKYRKIDTKEANDIVECLSEMAISPAKSMGSDDESEDAFFAYTQEWMAVINRGGLFEVNHNVYRFLRS